MRAYLGLGSNVGDRLANLQAAVNFIDLRAGRVLAVSRVYESGAMYVEAQPPFYNAAVEVETPLAPEALLRCLKGIEAEVGRIPRERYGPREIDIDVLALASGQEVALPGVTLPHPRLAERRFALEPLAEIAGPLCLGKGTVAEALAREDVQAQEVEVADDAVLSVHRD